MFLSVVPTPTPTPTPTPVETITPTPTPVPEVITAVSALLPEQWQFIAVALCLLVFVAAALLVIKL